MEVISQNKPVAEQDHVCSICKESYDIDSKTTLLCNHSYHYDCILEAFKYAAHANGKDVRSCPLCRQYGGFLPKKKGVSYINLVHMPEKGNHVSLDTNYISNSQPQFPSIIWSMPFATPIAPINTVNNSTNNNNTYNKYMYKDQCKGLIKTKGSPNYGKQCTHYSLKNNDYCGKHQSYVPK